jgi:type VI protein secretion system component Hcp
VVLSLVSHGAQGSDRPIDNVALAFSMLSVEYNALKADGSLAASVKGGYDLKANKVV